MSSKRVIMLDNMRAVLIVLVVFGHIIERVPFPGSQILYNAIYSFHMPAMVFLSGLGFRRNRTNIWKTTVLPYLIFQVIYLAEIAWTTAREFVLQFSVPEWVLWYLPSLFLWQMLTNLIALRRYGILAIALSVICALLIGMESRVGYDFSLSRTFVFLPFYLTGAYLRENSFEKFVGFFHQRKRPWVYCLLLAPAVITQVLLHLQRGLCRKYYFYAAVGYDGALTMPVRLMVMLTAASAIVALCTVIPKMKLPMISYIGRNTLPVFLVHGLIVNAATHLGCFGLLPAPRAVYAVVLTTGMVLLLASPPVAIVFKKLFYAPWGRTRSEEVPSKAE